MYIYIYIQRYDRIRTVGGSRMLTVYTSNITITICIQKTILLIFLSQLIHKRCSLNYIYNVTMNLTIIMNLTLMYVIEIL